MPYHWLDFTPPRPQIAAAPVANYSTAAHKTVTGLIDCQRMAVNYVVGMRLRQSLG